LLALAATAHHAHSQPGLEQPDLIIGHGVLGRMIARLAVVAGGNPTRWRRGLHGGRSIHRRPP
jgi:3-hydroxyethyl bacteriochlorophyllide a dehydrogenase